MQISIEPNNGIPIYEQLVRQVKSAIASGVVLTDQVIPSVREMAKQLAINPNTVQRAYLQLQDEQVLQSQRGIGMTVCAGAKDRCTADRHSDLTARLISLVSEALACGLDLAQLNLIFQRAIEQTYVKDDVDSLQTATAHDSSSTRNLG